MIPEKELAPREEIFTHFDPDDGVQRTYAVQRLLAHIDAHPEVAEKIVVAVEERHYREILHSIERHRVDRLRLEDMKKPILFIGKLPDDVLLADGRHRYAKFFETKIAMIHAWIVTQDVANQFLVDMPAVDPEALLRNPSGL